MVLGIMQPYFFPYIGYFDLMNRAHRWVVFDTAQYIRHGWVNRNRVLHPTSGSQYIIVPLQKHSRETSILDVQVAEGQEWKERIVGQLMHYKKSAPFFTETLDLVRECLEMPHQSLARLNGEILTRVCTHLGIDVSLTYFSDMNLSLGPIEGPGDWALRISEALDADEYINPPGGAALFDAQKFLAKGIELRIQNPVEFVYECGRYEFVPNLSIVDVLMWNSPGAVKQYLDTLANA